jgi:hypothetical protein
VEVLRFWVPVLVTHPCFCGVACNPVISTAAGEAVRADGGAATV